MANADDFMECDTCRLKRGALLCAGCEHNRRLIGMLRANLDAAFATVNCGCEAGSPMPNVVLITRLSDRSDR